MPWLLPSREFPVRQPPILLDHQHRQDSIQTDACVFAPAETEKSALARQTAHQALGQTCFARCPSTRRQTSKNQKSDAIVLPVQIQRRKVYESHNVLETRL